MCPDLLGTWKLVLGWHRGFEQRQHFNLNTLQDCNQNVVGLFLLQFQAL